MCQVKNLCSKNLLALKKLQSDDLSTEDRTPQAENHLYQRLKSGSNRLHITSFTVASYITHSDKGPDQTPALPSRGCSTVMLKTTKPQTITSVRANGVDAGVSNKEEVLVITYQAFCLPLLLSQAKLKLLQVITDKIHSSTSVVPKIFGLYPSPASQPMSLVLTYMHIF